MLVRRIRNNFNNRTRFRSRKFTVLRTSSQRKKHKRSLIHNRWLLCVRGSIASRREVQLRYFWESSTQGQTNFGIRSKLKSLWVNSKISVIGLLSKHSKREDSLLHKRRTERSNTRSLFSARPSWWHLNKNINQLLNFITKLSKKYNQNLSVIQ